MKMGALPSPESELQTAWTLASVGAPTVYADSCFIDQTWMVPSMQGQIGCCVGCSFEEVVRNIVYIATGVQCNPGTPNELSWRFVYAVCKALEGTPGYEQYPVAAEGTYPALAALVVRKYGIPKASLCPNNVTLDHETFVYNRLIANIPAAAFPDALTRRSGADMTVPVTIDGIMQAINYAKANKGGVAILRQIGDSYWAKNGVDTWDKALLLPISTPDSVVSGHEEFLYGYDKEPLTGRVRLWWLNHWSSAWCSTGGNGTDGGRGWEYADVWLPFIKEIRCVVTSVPVAPQTFKYVFNSQLDLGAKGADVVALQHALSIEGFFPAGTPFTGYFGTVTQVAVQQFQTKYGIVSSGDPVSTGYGRVGGKTLIALNQLFN